MKTIKNLKFSHNVAKTSYNNIHIDAYYLDDNTYRLNRYIKNATGKIVGKQQRLDISIDSYDNLDSDDNNNLIRFFAVNNLFV